MDKFTTNERVLVQEYTSKGTPRGAYHGVVTNCRHNVKALGSIEYLVIPLLGEPAKEKWVYEQYLTKG